MSDAIDNINGGKEFPYNGRRPSDQAEEAALGILFNFGDRQGIKNELSAIDGDIRDEIVISMADIIRTVYAELEKDTRRLDWLADQNNHIGNVQLPKECVLRNLDSLRAAIDDAMEVR